MSDALFIAFQYAVPQHLLTRLAGRLARSRSSWIKGPFIRRFIAQFDVDMSQAANPDPESYACFNDFFTRALKPGARPIVEGENALACPADGSISQIGQIREGEIFQAKGKSFSLEALLGDKQQAAAYQDGSFVTVYLSPRDYHRLHMPVDGKLISTQYIPGKLFSVNEATAQNIDGLFAKNERLVMHFDTPAGPMAAVMVGAMIVGGMETVWDQQVADPAWQLKNRDWQSADVSLKKGEELGRFFLGSTIILCFAPGQVAWDESLQAAQAVQMGQHFGVRT